MLYCQFGELFLEFINVNDNTARVAGIPVRADYRWFFVLVSLMSLITANTQHSSLSQKNYLREFVFCRPGFLSFRIFPHEYRTFRARSSKARSVVEIVFPSSSAVRRASGM